MKILYSIEAQCFAYDFIEGLQCETAEEIEKATREFLEDFCIGVQDYCDDNGFDTCIDFII